MLQRGERMICSPPELRLLYIVEVPFGLFIVLALATMSSVTRLHLLSQSMLNVSCQKQQRCSSLPADSPAGSRMEFVGQSRPSGACSLLGVPGLSSVDVDDDECEVVIGIRPKSSPLPRRRSSASDDDSEPGPPLSGSRRVSFADAIGLSLVQVKEFDTWDVPKLPECDSSEGEGKDAEEFFISPLTFSLPFSTEELFIRVREQKVELENIELLPGTTILKGVIRVLNISFSKVVYIRTTLDTWSSHFDLLAEYMPGSSDSLTDRFSFKLTLVPPFGELGARVDFCLRYETPAGTFWANNNDRNYVLFCHQRVKERKEAPQKEKLNKRSCLKTVGQNFSTVENISSSSQENISDVSEYGKEADTTEGKQISDGQSGTSEEDRQKFLAESRRSCSQRSRRKAAQMARVRDYFSQRDGGADDTERDESPPEAKAQEENPEEKKSNVQPHLEGSSKSEGSHFVSESLETGSEPLLDVPYDASSPAHDTSNSKTEKSESLKLAATLTGGETAMDVPDNPLHSNYEPAPAKCQNINESVSKAEESNITAEPADRVISAGSSFTFGTVVAPLYHQVFGQVGSESNQGNTVQAALHAGDLIQSYSHSERGQTSCTVPTGSGGNDGEAQGNVIKTQESNQECFNAAPSSPLMEEEETNYILDHAETMQDEIVYLYQTSPSGDTVINPNTVAILNTDFLNAQISSESSHLQGEAQEDNLTHDPQLPEQTRTQTNLDEAQREKQEVMTGLETSFLSPQPPRSVSEHVSDATDQQTTNCKESNKDGKTINAMSEDKLIEVSHDLKAKHISSSTMKETQKSFICCFEIVEEKDVTAPLISLQTNDEEEGNKVVNNSHECETKHSIDEAAESRTKATLSNHIHGDVLMELKGDNTRKKEHQKDFCLADTTEVNWEMMVEEEEKDVFTDEEKSEAIVEKDHGELEDAEREMASEKRDTTETENEDEVVWEITAAREEEAEVADVLGGKQLIGGQEIGEIVAEEDREESEKELEYVQVAKTAGEEELAEVIKVEDGEEEEETKLEREKLFAESQEVNIEEINDQDEEEEMEEGMEIEWNDYYEAGVEWEDQEEENPDYKEGILIDETGEIADAKSESMTVKERENEVGCFEERLSMTQNKIEDSLSAPVNNVHNKRVMDKENGYIPTEMPLYNVNVTHDLSAAARDETQSVATEGVSCIFTDEPESDQTSNDSASAESDSDDEVELYMHCLRVIHTGALAQKDRSKDAGFSASTRPSASRSKLLSSPMPSISESLDEEQHLRCLQDNHEDAETADIQSTAAFRPASSGQESISRNVSWWKETFSCSNISKTLLYATLLVVFLVVAYRYDFLACLGLYLVSLVWLCCQGERQPEQQKHQNRLN